MGSMPRVSKVGTHCLGEPSEKSFCVCVTGVRKDRRWFIMFANCYEELHFVALITETCCFWPP